MLRVEGGGWRVEGKTYTPYNPYTPFTNLCFSTFTQHPSTNRHTLIVPNVHAEAKRELSGLTTMKATQSIWPYRIYRVYRVYSVYRVYR